MTEGEQKGDAARGWAPDGPGTVRWWNGTEFTGAPVADPGPGPWPAGWYPHPTGPFLGYWDGTAWVPGRFRGTVTVDPATVTLQPTGAVSTPTGAGLGGPAAGTATWAGDGLAAPGPGTGPEGGGGAHRQQGEAAAFARKYWFPITMGTLVVVAAVVIALALGGPDEKTREAGERMASRAFMTAIFEGWSTPEEADGEANMERRAKEKCEELAWEVYFVGDDYVGPEQIDREAAAGVCTDTVMELLLMPVGP